MSTISFVGQNRVFCYGIFMTEKEKEEELYCARFDDVIDMPEDFILKGNK